MDVIDLYKDILLRFVKDGFYEPFELIIDFIKMHDLGFDPPINMYTEFVYKYLNEQEINAYEQMFRLLSEGLVNDARIIFNESLRPSLMDMQKDITQYILDRTWNTLLHDLTVEPERKGIYFDEYSLKYLRK